MGTQLLWTGLTLIVAADPLGGIPGTTTVGAIFMLLGVVLLWLDK